MARLFTKDGRAVEVPDDKVLAALQSGQLGVGGPQNVVSAAGDVYRANSADELMQALQTGMRVETAPETQHREIVAQYGDRNLEAFLAGAARGATLGLSDLALTSSGLVSKESLAGLREANPDLTLGSELLGSFAPGMAVGKGLSLAAKAFRMAPEAASALAASEAAASPFALATTASAEGNALRAVASGAGAASKMAQVGGWAAIGATEGGLQGLQEGITERALGDPQAAAEGLLSHVGEGALKGMLFGSALGLSELGVGALGKGLKRLTEKAGEALGEGTFAQKAERLSQKATFEAAGLSPAETRSLREKKGEAWFKNAYNTMHDEGIHPDGRPIIHSGMAQGEVAARLVETTETVGPRIGKLIEDLDAAATKLEKRVDILQEVKGPAPEAPVQGTEIPGRTPLAPPNAWLLEAPAGTSKAPLGEPLAPAPEWADPKKWEVVGQFKQSDFPDVPAIVKAIKAEGEKLSNSVAEDSARNFFKNEAARIEAEGEWTFSDAQKWRKSLSKAYGNPPEPGTPKWAMRRVERIINTELENKAEALLQKVGRPEVFAGFKRDKKIYSALVDIAEKSRLSDQAPGLLGLMGEAGGKFLQSLGLRSLVFGQGPGTALAGAAGYGAFQALASPSRLLAPSTQAVLARRIAGLRSLQSANEKVVGRLDGVVSKLVSAAIGEPARAAALGAVTHSAESITGDKDKEAASRKFVESVRASAGSPDELANRIAANLAGVEEFAPTVGAQMAQRMVFGLKQIEALLPPAPRTMQPQLVKHAEEDLGPAIQAAGAFIDPVGVMERLAAGVPPSRAEMAIVRTVYERMWSMASAQIAQKLASSSSEIDYDQALLLADFTGQPLHWSLNPSTIARNQAAFQPEYGAGSRGGGLQALQGAVQGFQSEPGRIATGQLGGR